MQQFVVPQFIDVEDKVIGPITVRQFIILLVGGGLVFIAYRLSDFALFLIEFVFIATLFFTVAFVKVNGKPIHYLLLNIFQTLRRAKIRVWDKKISLDELKNINKNDDIDVPVIIPTKNRARASRLAELSLVVDTGGVYQGESELLPNEELV